MLLAASAASAGEPALLASEQDSSCAPLELSRVSIFASHWRWSGIFPFYGGFIPDPHIACFPAVQGPPSVAIALGASEVRVQIAFLNPFFNDESSRVFLLIDGERGVRAIRVETPADREIHGFARDKSELRSFAVDGRAFVLIDPSWSIQGLVRLPVPGEKASAPLIAPGSPEFESVLRALAAGPTAADAVAHLCEPREGAFVSLAFVWLGGCPGFDFQAHFKKEPRAMYEAVWITHPPLIR